MSQGVRSFVGGDRGSWCVLRMETVSGRPLAPVKRLAVVDRRVDVLPEGGRWLLRGVASYERYVTRAERDMLVARQQDLGRPEATRAALIPISKSASWWELPQDERRAIFETRSEHIKTGLGYLPGVARRLLHGRELGEEFDFLTWFEYAPADAAAFEELVRTLRGSEEWRYVQREIDVRLARDY